MPCEKFGGKSIVDASHSKAIELSGRTVGLILSFYKFDNIKLFLD